MSSESIDKKHQKFDITESLCLKSLIIPFSRFFANRENYIYNGEEKIPFNLRHPKYKEILLDEFL